MYFFVSYARGDDHGYVRRFYEDLSAEIRVRTGARGQVGFMDVTDIRLGARWPDELVTALSECSVFLPLYSPQYFLSHACAMEWAAFEVRMRRRQASTGIIPNNIIPVLWLPPTSLPETARSIQYRSLELGDLYAKHGLRQLIRLQRYGDEYTEAVTALAEAIIMTSELHTQPTVPLETPMEALENPFARAGCPDPRGAPSATQPQGASTAAPVHGTGTSTGPVGHPVIAPSTGTAAARPRGQAGHVHFVIASAGRDEMADVRTSLQYYGPTAHHWAPYRPDLEEPLGTYACAIACRQRFGAEMADLTGLHDRMDLARDRNEIVVLLVDPWISRIAGYGASLTAYDQLNKPSSPVLIALSARDEETVHHRDALAEGLARTLPNNWMREDSIFREEIRDADQFARDLAASLDEALNRLLKRGTVFRRPPIEATSPRPILEGPTG